METLLEWAGKDHRVEKISLEVSSINRRAAHVYNKYGITGEGIRKSRLNWNRESIWMLL